MRSFSCFKPRDPFRNWSKELDKRVAIWARNFDSSFKLLLLGPAGAGKTTIMKQMKIIHFEGFSLEERQQKAKEIRSNLLESVRELTACITASGHQITWCDKENQNRLDFINGLNLDDQTYDIYAAKIYDYSKRILTDKGVEELFAKLNQLSITHRSQYLLNRVDEIRNANYIPNNDDILQSRRKTSDIQKLEFQVRLPVKSGPSIQQTFCMFDVGGQRGERRKWIQVFDGVSAVMFLIDSSSFDAIDDENGRNKLKETINLFYEVWTTRFLLNSNFVLLFNKQDILREKIERGHRIEDHFPEYKLYKFQPTGERQRRSGGSSGDGGGGLRSEKLNLFRTSSNRSSRSGSNVPRASSEKLASLDGGTIVYDTTPANCSHNKAAAGAAAQQPAATPATKRKSASMYLFGSSSSRSSKSQAGGNKALKSPAASRSNPALAPEPSAAAAHAGASRLLPAHQEGATTPTITTTQPLAATTATATATQATRTTRPSDFHDASQLENYPHLQQRDQNRGHATTTTTTTATSVTSSRTPSCEDDADSTNLQDQESDQQQQPDQAKANHFAYLKARSFIRDKFLQVTRQAQRDFDQRKFSSPNLPVYNKGSNSLTDSLPKRNVCYHYTTATDTENIRDLFENLQKMVLKSTMKDLV